MKEVVQDPMDVVHKMMEISKLEVTKQNLNSLNLDLEKDLQRLDEANQVLLRKIQEKEGTIQSLEREIALSVAQAREREELGHIISEKEEILRDLELETANLEKSNKVLGKSVMELQKKVSRMNKNLDLAKGTLKQALTELRLKLQESTESCAEQAKELAKIESDYQSVYELCKDQAHYIKKYQEILKQMEKEKDMLLLEKEIVKAQNNSAQTVRPGLILVETIQSNVEQTIIKKQKRIFSTGKYLWCLVFVVMIFIRLLGYVLFQLQYINSDILVDALPMVMSRKTLKRLRDILYPVLTLEVEEVLPH
ncbi:PREDICTED: transmembrane and coiled-coil domain-containing protein 5B-like [Condylura cristata]|uniref:transmembrane and coiled-coil domain-containing protein 5B-like n=1 Tax=Condylura cristata TaxID=143302 RepID=UPI0006431B63|nr:PREDICTED: transmembrane and coiled-coil domain-containing protein 5B-like [Condylura cristata]